MPLRNKIALLAIILFISKFNSKYTRKHEGRINFFSYLGNYLTYCIV